MANEKKRTKRTPEQREAMKFAYWNKWCPGGDPNKVIRTKGITKDEWEIHDITNVIKNTPTEFDFGITREYN